MKVLITGGNGLIGSHLAEKFVSERFEVRLLDTNEQGENVQHLVKDGKAEYIVGSIADSETCRKVVEGCDYVCHLAALISVGESIRQPELYWKINLLGTKNMLKASLETGVKKFQFMSSCSVLGDVEEPLKADENWTKIFIKEPYSGSKLAAEYLCRVYHSEGLPVVITRGFNIFGPRQRIGGGGAVTANFIWEMLNGNRPKIFGDGSQQRDYVYVKDVADGIFLATISDKTGGETINLSSGETKSVKELAFQISRLITNGKIQPEFLPARTNDIKRSCGDNAKAKQLIGWEPKTEFQTALKETVEFYRSKLGSHG